jgi:N-acetylmuramoyl-L-alanine amidase
MITRKGLKALFLSAVIAVCCLTTEGLCQARVKQHVDSLGSASAASGERSIPIAMGEGVASLSVSDLCEALGVAWKWDMALQKLSCTKKGRRLDFVQAMPFYLVNDTLLQMPSGPFRQGGLLYLPAGLCAVTFGRMLSDSIEWHGEDSTFEVVVSAAKAAPALPAVPAVERAPLPTPADTTPVLAPKVRPHAPDTVKRTKSAAEAIKTIVIDPGHGGMDPGAIGPDGLQEKEVVLDIGLMVRDEFKKQPHLSVYMTRDKDVFIPLQDRTKFANAKKADLFVSIHANSIEGNAKKRDNTRGFKVYFLSQAKNEDDKLVAMRENAVIKLEDKTSRYDNLQDILIDMAGNEYLRESQDFSIMINETFHTYLKQIPKLQLGVGQANFWVLNGAYMPSVLIEVGFVSNRKEEESLRDPQVKKSIANGIYEAIMSFKKKYESEM